MSKELTLSHSAGSRVWFQSPYGDLGCRKALTPETSVKGYKFQSPCGDLGCRKNGSGDYLQASQKVSVPLRGFRMPKADKLTLKDCDFMFQSPCGDLGCRKLKA